MEFFVFWANIDAIDVANKIGIDRDYAANVINDTQGIDILYQTASDALYRTCSLPKEKKLPKNWKEKIDNDYLKRKK